MMVVLIMFSYHISYQYLLPTSHLWSWNLRYPKISWSISMSLTSYLPFVLYLLSFLSVIAVISVMSPSMILHVFLPIMMPGLFA
ncbi:uncharacterized protein EV420DRAFT_1507969 [Desarmillaria tabescens]|uniref:Uncharacterized protein n=1 Tax=Armillaria tabescens TaxID=1929756 RepID=A0AA39NKG4_ARMTA|nr:uncharacterized protein EV420DRAFT_1507969 [Desarmillaria tabescens]KAK0467275.1 hypothetical protein EV420DRAFT_1507969 [Desarmillaria tabescens]